MKYDNADGRKVLAELQRRADRTLAEVAELLEIVPSDAEGAAASDMAGRLAARLREMPEERRRAAMVNGAVAIADLGRLCRDLSDSMAELGGEIRRLNSHSSATDAYRRGRAAVQSLR